MSGHTLTDFYLLLLLHLNYVKTFSIHKDIPRENLLHPKYLYHPAVALCKLSHMDKGITSLYGDLAKTLFVISCSNITYVAGICMLWIKVSWCKIYCLEDRHIHNFICPEVCIIHFQSYVICVEILRNCAESSFSNNTFLWSQDKR